MPSYGSNVVALMTILELARNPPARLDPLRRQCKLQQVIHRREIGREHFMVNCTR